MYGTLATSAAWPTRYRHISRAKCYHVLTGTECLTYIPHALNLCFEILKSNKNMLCSYQAKHVDPYRYSWNGLDVIQIQLDFGTYLLLDLDQVGYGYPFTFDQIGLDSTG